jgi:hypothetical protein
VQVRRRSALPRTAAALALFALLAGACSSAGNTRAAATPEPSETTASETERPEPEASPTPTETETEVELAEAPDIVRGVYSTVYSFWGERWAKLIDLVETTEVNAIVIDVKDEAGTLLWHIDHPLAEAGGGAEWKPESDPEERLQMLLDAGGYAIARVACFKDTLVAQARPDLAVQDNRTGGAWKARKDFSWLNPYQDEAGQWCIDVGLDAIEMGFHEVQFDYIRFPNGGDGDTSVIQLPGVPDDRPRELWRHTDEITSFLATASEQIHAAGGLVSADLFGLVTYDFTWDAQGTGQVMEQIAEHVDFISPMVYPSHYGVGNYGLMPHPIEHPYETVWNSMQEAQMRVQGLRAEIRPWLEDFSAPWMGYPNHSPDHIRKQIQATYDNGIEGWLLWNAGNSYTESILEKGDAKSKADPDFVPPYRTANPDAPPGVTEEKVWPGMPPCKPARERLEIGRGNLAGSKPPVRAPGGDEPIECATEKSTPPATTGASASESEAADEPSPSESETE